MLVPELLYELAVPDDAVDFHTICLKDLPELYPTSMLSARNLRSRRTQTLSRQLPHRQSLKRALWAFAIALTVPCLHVIIMTIHRRESPGWRLQYQPSPAGLMRHLTLKQRPSGRTEGPREWHQPTTKGGTEILPQPRSSSRVARLCPNELPAKGLVHNGLRQHTFIQSHRCQSVKIRVLDKP